MIKRANRIIGHIFVDEDGDMTITPCLRIAPEDEDRLKAIWRHKFISADERLDSANKA